MFIKKVKTYRVLTIVHFIIFSTLLVFGQDLGSSNGLFRASNSKAKNTSVPKKSASKPKNNNSTTKNQASKTASKKNSSATTKSTKPTRTSSKNNDNRSAKIKAEPIKDVIITVGKTSGGDFEDIFEQAIEEGNQARDRREYNTAEIAYRRAKEIKSNDFRAIYGLGNIFSDQHRWDEAETAYREAIALAPDSSEPYIAISFVLTQPILGKDLSARFLEAQKMARRAIELDPKNPIAFDQLGVALELSGNIDKVTRDAYNRAVALDPEFALAYAHLGRLLRRNGKANESAEAYRRAIQLATDVPTLILIADVLQSQQRFGESEQLLRRALQEDQKNPTALFLYGRALIARSALKEAEPILKKSIEISPKSLISYTLLGSLYARRGDFTEAENILKKALQIVSENGKKSLALEFETLGDGLLTAGKKKDAVRVYRQAIALDSEKPVLNDKLTRAQKD